MQHLSLATGLVHPASVNTPQHYNSNGRNILLHATTYSPMDQWMQLRHFGPSSFVVAQDDLVDFLVEIRRLYDLLTLGSYASLPGSVVGTTVASSAI